MPVCAAALSDVCLAIPRSPSACAIPIWARADDSGIGLSEPVERAVRAAVERIRGLVRALEGGAAIER